MSEQIPAGVRAKVKPGHTLEWDPPGLSSASRWSCRTCGDAVLDYCGNVYGSVTERTCDESLEFWGVRRRS